MTAPGLAVVLVHYHGAEWLVRAVAALSADLERSGLSADLIVVDNGSTAEEARLIRDLPVRCIDAGSNRGYAGGVNLGIATTRAELQFAMNPDVEVLPGCLEALVESLRTRAAAVGPHFYWDRERRMSLPPTEKRNRRQEMLRALAPSGVIPAWIARRSWRAHARRHWLSKEGLQSTSLSGALLGWRREAWERIGSFDEGFKLYFEENDWLERLRAAGLPSLYVRRAEAVHYFNQSARHTPMAPAWFQESAARYEARYYGRGFLSFRNRCARAAESLAGPGRRPEPPTLKAPFLQLRAAGLETPGLWLEVSPSAEGFPAAAERLEAATASWSLPEDVARHLGVGPYRLRVVTDAGEEIAQYAFAAGV